MYDGIKLRSKILDSGKNVRVSIRIEECQQDPTRLAQSEEGPIEGDFGVIPRKSKG